MILKTPFRFLFPLLLLTLLLISNCAIAPPGLKEKVIGIGELSLEEKVAQMFWVRYSGGFYHESSYTYKQVKRLVEQNRIGGVILFSGSIHGTIQNLNELQKSSRVPLLVAADYERGVGQQLEGGTLFPSNMPISRVK